MLSAVAFGGTWFYISAGSFFFAHTEVNVSGGAAPYTYSWAVLTGDAGCLDPTNSNTSFTSPSGGTSTMSCTVTDANGLTGTSNTVSLHL